MTIKVIEIVPDLSPSSGGPSYTVPALCNALRKQRFNVKIITGYFQGEARKRDDILFNNIQFLKGVHNRQARIRYIPHLDKAIQSEIEGGQSVVIHSNGLWSQSSIVAADVARINSLPHVVTLRGMLTPWAMRQKPLKKTIAWHMYQKDILARASAVHATSQNEAEEFKEFGIPTPVTVIPNGVDANEIVPSPASGKSKKKQILFLSRIHPKKGLDMLVEAWRAIRGEGWECIVAGPNEDGYADVINRLIVKSGLENEMKVVGPVYGNAKKQLFEESSLFVLPTYSENYGVVVAEALAAELPVITTHGAPWEELRSHECGWWIRPDVNSLSETLVEAIHTPAERLEKMGSNGRALIVNKYTWDKIAEKFSRLFQSIVSQ